MAVCGWHGDARNYKVGMVGVFKEEYGEEQTQEELHDAELVICEQQLVKRVVYGGQEQVEEQESDEEQDEEQVQVYVKEKEAEQITTTRDDCDVQGARVTY